MVPVREVLATKAHSQTYTIRPDASVSQLLDALAEYGVGALIVSEDESSLNGIVSERDVVRKLRGRADASAVSVADIMTADVFSCSPDDSFEDLMAAMTEHRIRHVPVVEDGRLIGVVSIGDAVKHQIDQLQFERDQLNSYLAGG